MTTPATPAPGIAEAAQAIHDLTSAGPDGQCWCTEAVEHQDVMREAYAFAEAAAPHLAAAERDATVTAMYAGAAKAVENAVAAERERCVQLAHEYRAVYVTGNVIEGLETHPFADLLRQDGGT